MKQVFGNKRVVSRCPALRECAASVSAIGHGEKGTKNLSPLIRVDLSLLRSARRSTISPLGSGGRSHCKFSPGPASALLLGGQFEDLSNLDGTSDRPRVARHPWRVHRLFGEPREVLGPDLDGGEATRHADVGNKSGEHLAGILARMTHRRGDESLALGVCRLVPAHHRRQHDARCVAVRDVEYGTQHITDAVARTHWHTAGEWP